MIAMSHLDELDEFEAELELQLKKEYTAVFSLFRYCVLTQDATYLCNTLDLRYVPQAENTGEVEQEIGDDDLATAYYREGMLDLVELMREQFVLALPMKPLCAEDCRGLCPECGTNLNKGQCGCTPRWEDPRLAALKSLLPREKEN